MAELRRVDLAQLSSSQLSAYESFLVPSALNFIPHIHNYPLIIGVEAIKNDELIGFALAVCELEISKGRLASLFVKEEERNKRIGSDLLQQLEKELKKEGCEAVCTEYAEDNLTKESFEKILSHMGWSTPYIYMVCCHYDIKKFNPPWFKKSYDLPDSFQEFNWKDLTNSQRGRLIYLATQSTFHSSVSPFVEENTIEYSNSLGLRHKNHVIGWIVTHRMDPETIVYSALYLDLQFHHTGYALRLLTDAIKLQQQSSVPYILFRVNLEQINRSWLNFVKKRLIPYAQKVQRIKWSWHSI